MTAPDDQRLSDVGGSGGDELARLRASLRCRVRSFLEAWPPSSTPDACLRAARFDAGLAFVHFDRGAGGLGMPALLQPFVEREFLDAGAADWRERNIVGLSMAAPAIHEHGTPEQRRLLRPLFIGEDIWCQLFSEPGAGSDLASLTTTARRTDDGSYRITGQKVWTTLGHVASRAILLARTHPDRPRHHGLTYFLLDMRAPGIEVRPLRQMTGDCEFNEVFLDDVVVPPTAVLGTPGYGWRVAMTTLMNERAALGDSATSAMEGCIALYRRVASTGGTTRQQQDRVVQLLCRERTIAWMNARAVKRAECEMGTVDGTLGKIAMAELNQDIAELSLQLLGAEGMLFDSYEIERSEHAAVSGGSDPRVAFLRTRANSIEGGTSEILRNIVSERILGLPREPRPQRRSGEAEA